MVYIRGRKGEKERRTEVKEERKPPERLDIDLEKLKKAYKDIEEANRQIRESHMEMILNLAIAAEYKDPDTGSHILRISDYAAEVARALGLAAEEVEILRYASPMHDIGKLGIPDKILQKPGKLDPDEWEIMKQHPLIGARIFQNSKSPLLRAASQIALSHHEQYDGNGYPSGLKGEDIPLFGRIVTMVDIFDAIVSKRCYKSAASFREGMDYVKSLSGTYLDPKLVDLFVRIEGKIKEIYEANTTIQQFLSEFGGEESLRDGG